MSVQITWEYVLVTQLEGLHWHLQQVRDLGRRGWELVGVYNAENVEDVRFWIFKRPQPAHLTAAA